MLIRNVLRPFSPERLAVIVAGLGVLLAGCVTESSLNEVRVVGIDYAYQAPDTLPPGPTAIAFENRGKVNHEMILIQLKEGVTLWDVIEGVQGGADPDEFTEGGPGILMAGPGETAVSRLLVDLVPGRTYALVCNFRDSPEARSHTELGMVTAIWVTDTRD